MRDFCGHCCPLAVGGSEIGGAIANGQETTLSCPPVSTHPSVPCSQLENKRKQGQWATVS